MARKKAVKKRSLTANLARSADKRGLTGEARERYIVGGAINAEKRHVAKLAEKKARPRAAAVKKSPYLADGHKRLVLVARKNAAASASRSYDVYSIYEPDAKKPYTSATYRSRTEAGKYAKIEAEKHNHPKGVHDQHGFQY